ncbi:peptidoglycan-binding protein [Bradyrhizobium sp. 156]|uniref:peptidoglycan-binding protein n=1 Tax=Bradyrhizobium sp. 156 TaxID=2782630 RepID=UPI001FF78BA4|nr:peptidoglycan-binding protein [Bradyrhizobium sp. 156]MCK1322162.1 peptidoglycan-binding protein [Bradyrhizobium sp. 156]
MLDLHGISRADLASFSEALMRLWPHGDQHIPGLRQAMAEQMPAVAAKWGFDTVDVVAIFIGQVSLECGAGLEVVENLNYTAKRMMAVWPKRFPTLASAMPYAGNPKALANKTYNGRMGNRPGSDDGWNYRGRGGTQTTGHDGYEATGRAVGLDLLSDPDLVNTPEHFLETAAADFVKCGCLPFARKGDIDSVTHHLNGGFTGLADRKAWTKRWRAALAIQPAPAPAADGVLRLGAKGYEVTALQNRLVELGYTVGTVDGQFGRATRVAVVALQLDRGLAGTGEVDDATREALKRDLTKPVSEARADATADDLRQAGSATVAQGDTLTWWGKILTGLGLAGGGGHAAQQSGALDTVKDAADKVSTFRGVFEQVQDVAGWVVSTATTYWWVLLPIAGVGAIHYGRSIVNQRLQDHRSAVNMGR